MVGQHSESSRWSVEVLFTQLCAEGLLGVHRGNGSAVQVLSPFGSEMGDSLLYCAAAFGLYGLALQRDSDGERCLQAGVDSRSVVDSPATGWLLSELKFGVPAEEHDLVRVLAIGLFGALGSLASLLRQLPRSPQSTGEQFSRCHPCDQRGGGRRRDGDGLGSAAQRSWCGAYCGRACQAVSGLNVDRLSRCPAGAGCMCMSHASGTSLTVLLLGSSAVLGGERGFYECKGLRAHEGGLMETDRGRWTLAVFL